MSIIVSLFAGWILQSASRRQSRTTAVSQSGQWCRLPRCFSMRRAVGWVNSCC